MNDKQDILSYESSKQSPMRVRPRYWLLSASGIVGAIGVAIVVINNTAEIDLSRIGNIWLAIGFVTTVVFAAIALVDLVRACSPSTGDNVRDVFMCLLIFVSILANFPIAVMCIHYARLPGSQF